MLQFDLPLEQLKAYQPPLTKQPDFASFWDKTLAEALKAPINTDFQLLADYPVPEVEAFQVFYSGWRENRCSAWYLRPRGSKKGANLPAIVRYHGYSGNKGYPHELLMWALQGYAVMSVDVRGQAGDSSDNAAYSSGHVSGWMTKGIMDPEEYYYRAVYMDCVRAIELIASLPEVDASHIGVYGGSQGGGLSLAVAALSQRVTLAMPDVPYLCHFRRSLEMAQQMPYLELSNYFRIFPEREEQAFRTLSYFDNMNLAERITCPVLMTVGLLDLICPPSTIFATYNRINTEKRVAVHPYHGHEVPPQHITEQIRWANRYLRGLKI